MLPLPHKGLNEGTGDNETISWIQNSIAFIYVPLVLNFYNPVCLTNQYDLVIVQVVLCLTEILDTRMQKGEVPYTCRRSVGPVRMGRTSPSV